MITATLIVMLQPIAITQGGQQQQQQKNSGKIKSNALRLQSITFARNPD
jgi:hypothetical protein